MKPIFCYIFMVVGSLYIIGGSISQGKTRFQKGVGSISPHKSQKADVFTILCIHRYYYHTNILIPSLLFESKVDLIKPLTMGKNAKKVKSSTVLLTVLRIVQQMLSKTPRKYETNLGSIQKMRGYSNNFKKSGLILCLGSNTPLTAN